MSLATPSIVPDVELAALRSWTERALPRLLADLETLVNVDSGTYTKAGVDRIGSWTAAVFGRLGAVVEVVPGATLGDTVVGRFRGDGHARVLVIGHMDTVFDPGTAEARPFRIDAGRAYGPGVADMKAGLLAGLYAIEALREVVAVAAPGEPPSLPFAELTFVANPDEEIGSPVSTPVIRAVAPEHDAALVLECARANGDVVSSRKGNLDARLTVRGRAAHAGVEPEKGRSAVLEAGHKILALHRLNGRWDGVTVNVGAVRGGTRPNIVPDEAVLEVDVRAPTRSLLEQAEAAVREIAERATVEGTGCDVSIGHRHWPMEKLAPSERLIDHAVDIAGRLGFGLHDATTGGASDANTTAGLGVPSLDGMGPIGGLDHSPDEYIEVDSIVPRITLFAGLLLAIARDPEVRAWRGTRG